MPLFTLSPSEISILGFKPSKSVPRTAKVLGFWPSYIFCSGEPSMGMFKPRFKEKFVIKNIFLSIYVYSGKTVVTNYILVQAFDKLKS